MIWVSFNNWSLITPPRYIGLDNFERALARRAVLDLAGVHPQVHPDHHPDPDDRRLPDRAARRPSNSPLRRFTRTVVFIPVVIGLGVSSLLWYWLFSSDFGFVNRILLDIGIIERPVLWLGVDADRSNYAIIASIVWKVIGFGMILFVGAIQAIPTEITEATMVDGASYWQRVRRVILPLTRRTVLLVTLISVIGSLLAFDQFYIMTAGQPHNETATSVFYVYLNSFPYLKLGLRGGAVADPRGDRAGVHRRPDGPHPPERGMSAGSVLAAREARGAAEPAVTALGRTDEVPRRGHLPGPVRDHADAAGAVDPGVVQVDRRGGGAAADVHPERDHPRQLRAPLDLPGRAADLPRQQLRDGVPDDRVRPAS